MVRISKKISLLDNLIKETENNNQEYKKWLENQVYEVYYKVINNSIISEIGISKDGLIIYIYTVKEWRQKGCFTELLEQVEGNYSKIDFWTYNKNIQNYLQKRKYWNRIEILKRKRTYIKYAYNNS